MAPIKSNISQYLADFGSPFPSNVEYRHYRKISTTSNDNLSSLPFWKLWQIGILHATKTTVQFTKLSKQNNLWTSLKFKDTGLYTRMEYGSERLSCQGLGCSGSFLDYLSCLRWIGACQYKKDEIWWGEKKINRTCFFFFNQLHSTPNWITIQND